MKYDVNDFDTHVIFDVEGSLTVENIRILEDVVESFVKEKKNIIFNLSEVSYIDSSSIRFILYFFSASEKNNRYFCLTNLNDEIYQMFSITELDKRLHIFETTDKALSFISKSE